MQINTRVIYYTLVVSLGGFIFGFDASVISGAIGFITTEFNLTPWQQGFVVSSPTLGGIIATITAGAISDAYGRRKTLIMIALLYLVSAVTSAFAIDINMLIASRFIGGMAFCSLMIAPLYIAEISSAEHRGKLVSVNQFNIVLGFSVSYFSNYYFLSLSQSSLAWVNELGIQDNIWRYMLGMEIFPALLWFVLLFTIPRSPRWLMMKSYDDEAKNVLVSLFGNTQAIEQLKEIKASIQIKTDSFVKRVGFLFDKRMRFPLVIGLILGVAQQATGINVVFFYAPTIFEQSGVGTNAAFMQAALIGIVNIVFTVVAMFTIDRFGRKPLLILGLTGIVFSMALCSWSFSQAKYQIDETNLSVLAEKYQELDTQKLDQLIGVVYESDVAFKNALGEKLTPSEINEFQADILQASTEINASLVLVGIIGFVASFAFSLGPVMWVMFSEIFPNHIRGLAISAVGVVNSAVSFLVQFIFPWELANYGASVTFATYAGFAVVGLYFVLRYLPETKGKSLENLQQELARM